jgi:hypothetical protein
MKKQPQEKSVQERSPDPEDRNVPLDEVPEDVQEAWLLTQAAARALPEVKGRRPEAIVGEYLSEQIRRVKAFEKPLDFEYAPGRPTLVIKLGSEARGWVPNSTHFDKVKRFIKASGIDKEKNVLLYHFAIQFTELPK